MASQFNRGNWHSLTGPIALIGVLLITVSGCGDGPSTGRGVGQTGIITAADDCEEGSSDTLVQFAKKCKDAIGIDVPAFNCDDGTLVPETHLTGTYPDQYCDRPNVLNHQCDPNSRFQILKETDDVSIVAHCRKRGNSGGKYGDIAVIQYNQKNGATCFYQALGILDANVTAPSAGNGAGKFPWKDPQETAAINCVRCHDNGPFVRSLYLAQLRTETKNRLPGTKPGTGSWEKRYSWNKTIPYKFVGSDFQSWKVASVQVTGTGAGSLGCHRLGISSAGGTYRLKEGTAQDFGPLATAEKQAQKHPHSSESPIWMTPSQTVHKRANETAAEAVADCAKRIVQHWNDPSKPRPPSGCQAEEYGQGDTCRGVIPPDSAAQTKEEVSKTMQYAPVEKHVIDFSESEGLGVPGGGFENFAFRLDLGQRVRKIAYKAGIVRKDLVASYDFSACSPGQEGLLEKPLGDLAPGTAAWVDYLDIEMLPLAQRDIKWEGGVCYGYRKPSGTWYWYLAPTALVYDAESDRMRARLWVKEADIDAIKLVFDASVPRRPVSRVVVTTLVQEDSRSRPSP